MKVDTEARRPKPDCRSADRVICFADAGACSSLLRLLIYCFSLFLGFTCVSHVETYELETLCRPEDEVN